MLIVAAQEGNVDDIEVLLRRGADIHYKDDCGLTPLHHAAWNGQYKAAELLLSRGASVTARSNFGSTPLHSAADKNEPRTVHLLLTHGAVANSLNNGGLTPLHYASTKDNADTARVLLDKGAQVNAQDGEGRTALHMAAKHGCIAVGCLLLDYGAMLFAKDFNGETALEAAVNNRTATALRLRVTAGLKKKSSMEETDYVTTSMMQTLLLQNRHKKAEMSSRFDTDEKLQALQKEVNKYQQEDMMRTTEMEEMKNAMADFEKKEGERKILKASLEQIVAIEEKNDLARMKKINELQAQLKIQEDKEKSVQAKASNFHYTRA